MNNSITATIFVAMMLTMALSATYVFAPSPAVIFKTTEGESTEKESFSQVGGGGRGR